ncbi:MAG: tail fiber domain-containing protein [Bacteroidales bacterium]
MKTKLLLLSLFTFAFSLFPCKAQVPQGLNYQAIARDATGNPITGATMQVKIGILSDTILNTMVWEELFNPVKTNAFGMFTVVVGTGVRQSGSAYYFNTIDWTKTPLFLRTSIYYPSTWKVMGTSKLQSVPYSMVAGNLEGTVPLLSVKGNTTTMDSALFVVRNNTGQIVFAVYNEGVRIYVDDGIPGKGTSKGGFAVGGFNKSKGTVQNYLVVRPDTFRIFFDDTPGKGTKGGFAIGGFSTTKSPGAEYLGVKGTTPDIINPSKARILWYPLKEAFLTGRVIVVSPDSIGLNSLATGFESKAKGNWSQALGYQAVAKGNYSTSIGKNSLTSGTSSFAFGDHSKATGDGSYAFGTYATASGSQSIAIGSVGMDSLGHPTGGTTASGFGAFAAGFGSVASGQGAFTLGVNDTASYPFSTAMGFETVSNGWFNTSMGVYSKSGGFLASTATGWGTTVEYNGVAGMANGCLTKSGNWVAAAFGDRTYASGHTSFATGYNTTASGHLSSTFGEYTIASGDGAIAMGHYNTAQAYGSLVIGRYNLIAGTTGSWITTDPAFVIGNGSSASARSNAVTVYKNGSADFGGSINLNKTSTNGALYVNSAEALWYNGTYYSWGYGATYNVFAKKTSIATTASPGSYSLYVVGNAYSTGTWAGSDVRWKKNLQPVGNIMPGILELNGYYFDWRREEFPDMNFETGRQLGLVAQEVEKVFPQLVKTDDNGYKAVAYDKISVLLLEGMKEQQKQINSQKQENNDLRSELNALKEEVEQLKSSKANR